MNRGFSYYFSIYRKIMIQDIKSKMSYRADFVISMIGMIAQNVVGLFSFWLIFQRFPNIRGWNYYEIVFLYGFTLLAATPAQCFFDNNWSLRLNVYSGDFIKYCFRPMNLYFYYISEIFDLKGIWQLFFGIGTVIYAWTHLALPINVLILIEFIIALISASLFYISLLNIGAASSFWIVKSFFVLQFLMQFKQYAHYPVIIFKPALRILFTFVIPMAFMAFYPSMLFLRPHQVNWMVWFTPVYGMIFFFISYKIWMKGALSFDGTGS